MLPSLSALDKYSSDHLMSSLGFSHYTTIGVRKLPEGNHLSGSSSHPTSLSPIPNYSSMVTSPSPVTTILAPVTTHATYSTTMAPSSSSTTSAYSYFAAPSSVDLSSPLYGSYTTTGVFSSKTLQPSRPRSKARANAGKIPSRYFSGLVAPLTPVHGFESRHGSLTGLDFIFLHPQLTFLELTTVDLFSFCASLPLVGYPEYRLHPLGCF